MTVKKIAVLTDMRNCDFDGNDFINIFLEIQNEGEIICARFYNCLLNKKSHKSLMLYDFIEKNNFEVLPHTLYQNTVDVRVVIDTLSLIKQKADIIVLVNIPDDDILVDYIKSFGVEVYSVKCHIDNKKVFAMYERVYMLATRYKKENKNIKDFELIEENKTDKVLKKTVKDQNKEKVSRQKVNETKKIKREKKKDDNLIKKQDLIEETGIDFDIIEKFSRLLALDVYDNDVQKYMIKRSELNDKN